MEENVNNQQKSNSNKAIIIVLVLIIIGLLGFIVYDKFIQEDTKSESGTQEKECNCPKCDECEKCESSSTQCTCSASSCLGEKITSFKKIELTDKNQEIKIGKKTYKVRKNKDGVLYVNDENPLFNDEYYPDYVYLTDKFAIFTNGAQFKEHIGYALSENGSIVVNNNNSQMENFKMIDGYLHAYGGEIYSGEYDLGIKEGDLIIKYIDNTLIVTPFK